MGPRGKGVGAILSDSAGGIITLGGIHHDELVLKAFMKPRPVETLSRERGVGSHNAKG